MTREDREPNACEPGHAFDVEGHSVPPVPENLAEIIALKGEIERLNARAVRSTADAEIAQQRCERAVEDARKFAVNKFAYEVLTVADNLRRALAAVETVQSYPSAEDPMLEGVQATERILASVLERFHVQKVGALGALFDPNCQEAVLEVQNGDHAPGTVVQVLEDGYTISGRLLRPARVVIAARGGDREHRSV